MTKAKDIARLRELSGLILDQKLAVLQSRAAERSASLQRLHDLAPSGGAEPVTLQEMQIALRYDHWADARRSEINRVLARQTAEWLEARADANRAFGRADVLRKLHAKIGK